MVWAQETFSPVRKALQELVKRVEIGDAKAMYDLARLHDSGYDSISRDTLRSTALYLASAEKGYAPAMNFIGFRYYKGEGVIQNTDSAIYWIRHAAEKGDITAAANLGYLLTESTLIPHDFEEAEKWLLIASEEGVTEAQIKLAEMMKDKWAALPSDSALKLGKSYYLGKAPVIGVELLEVASHYNDPKALALLGDAYAKGIGVPYNHQKSIDFFYKAAIGGDPSAMFVIAEMLDIFPDALSSDTILRENNNAGYWYEKAASSGVTDSDKAYELLYSLP